MRGQRSHEFLVAGAAVLFLVAHMGLARLSLEDIDSLNFALGIRDYDVTRHQPHPPGYPVFIVVARGATWLAHAVRPGLASAEAVGLTMVAAFAGAVAIVMSRRVLLAVGFHSWVATAGALLFATAPLPWITAARPMSDAAGLAASLVSQWLLLSVVEPGNPGRWRRVAVAGLCTGLALGVRSQVLWLTLPLAGLVAVGHVRARQGRGAVLLGVGLLAGMLTWATPMVLLNGGIADYLNALEDQADEDFEGVPMLARQIGVGRLRAALGDTFVQPWAVVPLAVLMTGGALAGSARLLLRLRRPAAMMALLWAPYAIFHLLYQETETTRYALPLMLPLCALAAVAVDGLATGRGRPFAPVTIALVGLAMVSLSLQASWQYRQAPEGVFDALRALRQVAEVQPPDMLLMHRRVWAETRRARELLPLDGADNRPVPPAREWLAVLPWLERPHLHAWWLVDPRRGDRATIDPRSLTLRERFAWPAPLSALLGGIRPHPFDWFVIDDPSWVLHDGWALTPELAGMSRAAGQGAGSVDGARATVRASSEARTLLIGGRHLGTPETGLVTLRVAIGDTWSTTTQVAPGAFHRVWTLPAGAAPVPTASEVLTVHAAGAAGQAIALEQFDLQPVGVPLTALGNGWFEPERDVTTGRTWRWMSDRASVDVEGAGCEVRLTISGTWPRHYDAPPTLTVQTSTGTPLLQTTLSRPFAAHIVVPAQAQSEGRVALDLTVSRSFVAGEQTGSADARRLAIEVGSLAIEPTNGTRSCAIDVDSATHESVVFRR